jgi:hypothetical protein
VPEPPESFDELINSLREHPEWRRSLRDVLAGEPDVTAEAPARHNWTRRFATLGMGFLIGGLAAGLVAFALLRDDGGNDAVGPAVEAPGDRGGQPLPESVAPAAQTPEPSPTPLPATATPTATPIPEEPSPTPTAPLPTPTPTARSGLSVPATATASATPPPPPTPGPPRYTFAGFNGTCAPVEAIVNVENLTTPVTISGRWVQDGGSTVISVEPLVLQPMAPGAVVTVRFPTVAPLTPGQYTFTAVAGGAVVVTASTAITC